MSISPKSRSLTYLVARIRQHQRIVPQPFSVEVGDPVKLVCELYKIFRRETQSTETLDDFYFWGEMLISDFDDADKK